MRIISNVKFLELVGGGDGFGGDNFFDDGFGKKKPDAPQDAPKVPTPIGPKPGHNPLPTPQEPPKTGPWWEISIKIGGGNPPKKD